MKTAVCPPAQVPACGAISASSALVNSPPLPQPYLTQLDLRIHDVS
jgi:hypothetical protein